MIKKKKKNVFQFFFCQEPYVYAVILGEMLQIWLHLCSTSNFYFWTDIVLEQRERWQQRRDDDDKEEVNLDWDSRVQQLKQVMPECTVLFHCLVCFFLDTSVIEKEELIFFTESDLNTAI